MPHTAFGVRVALLGLLVVVLSACAGAAPASSDPAPTEPLAITVTMQEFTFDPAQITAKVGQPVKLTLVNKGALLHDFSSMDAEVEVMHMEEGDEHEMDEMDMAMMMLHTAVDVGHTQSMEFTPTKAGTYTFFCTVEGHKEAGMTGILVVTP